MIEAVDLSFAYARRRATPHRVLDRVTVRVERGAVVGLLGPNGSGKTTLLRLFAGMLQPDSGQVRLDATPIAAMARRDIARRIAVVPQDTHTTFDFSVIDMVLMGRYPHLGPFELEGVRDLEIAREALSATGTSALEARSFSTLSGGEKQRVVIAAAIAQAADVLLLDEPTAALDIGYQFEIASLLKRLNAERQTTMVVSTHDLNVVASMCDSVILLKDGRVIAQGLTDETLTPDNIRRLYELEADVQFHQRAGHLTVVPLGRAH
jgi:iron complex transport system ATP-binding protein